MRGPPNTFWGKLTRDAEKRVVAWHPLIDHCADVATCCEALLERTLLRSRLAALGGLSDLDPAQCARLCVLAALHDLGKFNHGFQRKALSEPRDVAGHVGEIVALLLDGGRESDRARAAIAGAGIEAWGAERLLWAALTHHGKPVQAGEVGPIRRDLWRSHGGVDPVDGMQGLVKAAVRWFRHCGDPAAAFPEVPAFAHGFSGLVTLADWMGSDERLFPYAETGDPERIEVARTMATAAVRALSLDAPEVRAALGDLPEFAQLFGNKEPRPAQRVVLDLPITAASRLEILEAETGSGKTEAALARFFALLHAGEVDGLYFALPTRTAASQIHRRVLAAVKNAFTAEDRRPPVVLAVPGYFLVDDLEGRRGDAALAPFGVLWPDDERDRSRFRTWAAENSKRYLAGAIVVGTIDQVLLSALAVKHSHLRATALLRHFLVVDEVHASDDYMNRLLEEVLARHLEAGGRALLMSATLGAAARARFLAAGRAASAPPLRLARQRPYPCVTTLECSGERVIEITPPGRAKEIAVELSPALETPEQVAVIALAAARRGARVIVLRNTVTDALATQDAVERAVLPGDEGLPFSCEGMRAPHHARFAREDRLALDGAIESAFGVNRPPGGCVVVATQTVQQSLDLDADLLVTDLCPIDVLLQRIGRLHRHQREVRLRILEATWQLAERKRFTIPAENRDLVESATHPEALKEIAQRLGGNWLNHQSFLRGSAIAKGGQASLVLVNWSEPYGDRGFPNGLDARVSTRLGAGDRLARFAGPVLGPFGRPFAVLTIPAWLARDADEESSPEEVTMSAGTVRFRFGSRRFVYDRLGLRPDTVPSSDGEEDSADA